MAKVLFFFTSNYPFGTGETFIENEIEYLAEALDKIVIVSNNTLDKQTRAIPENVTLERKSYELEKSDKVKALYNVFNSKIKKELTIIKTVYKKELTRSIFNTMILSLRKMNVWSKYIDQLIKKHCALDDNVYLYSYWANDIALAISAYNHELVKKKICRAHGWDVYFEANDINYLPFRRAILEGLDKEIFISQKGKSYYKNLFPELTNKMKVSHLGVHCKKKKFTFNAESALRIVSCSNVIPLKRVNLIANAISKIEDIEIEWHHFGDGYLSSNLKNETYQLLNHKNTIQYHLHGHISNKKYFHFLINNKVDIFINASTTEGIPVSIMEAMSFSIPCIATAVGGTPEIVNNKNGILLSPNPTPEEIADQIIKFYHLTTNAKEEKRNAAFQTWNEKFNAEKNYTNFVQSILKL